MFQEIHFRFMVLSFFLYMRSRKIIIANKMVNFLSTLYFFSSLNEQHSHKKVCLVSETAINIFMLFLSTSSYSNWINFLKTLKGAFYGSENVRFQKQFVFFFLDTHQKSLMRKLWALILTKRLQINKINWFYLSHSSN